MAEVFISDLPELNELNDDVSFVTDDGAQSNSIKAKKILDYVRESFKLDNSPIVVGDTEPAYTNVLWFNTAPASIDQAVATLSITDEETDYSVNVDGTEHSVSNISETEGEEYSYEIKY